VDIPFQAIAEWTFDWESWLDQSGQVRWVNSAITRITGYSVDEGLAMPDYPLPLVFSEDAPIMQRVLDGARRGESGNHVEFRVLQKNGHLRWTAISWQPLYAENGKTLGVRTSVRDIDAHKQLEQLLETALRTAEAANHAKAEFLANVSHELRTPLISVLGYTELLRRGSQDPKQKRYLATIASQGRQLERLVSDLLDYSTLSAGRLPLRPAPVRPDEVVREAVRALLPRAQEKGLELRADVHPCPLVSMDAARLTQVVSSLIDNAIKYTAGGQVSVRSHREADTGLLVVIVEDTGPGLPAGLSLFEPFRQGDGPQSGVGLGLAIAQRLCRTMGGDLTADVQRHPGARFTATFQASLVDAGDEPKADLSARPALLAHAFPLDILVVDDVSSAREFLADALRSFGYHPRTSATGMEAVAQASQRAPDVTFIDLRMPGQDGWSLARELRRLLGPGYLLVGSSASHLLADSPGLAAAGFDAFLPKPTPLLALENLLRKAATQRQLGLRPEDDSFAAASTETTPGEDVPLELAQDRLAELAALTGPSGQSLLAQTLTRVAAELPELLSRVRSGQRSVSDLTRATHDLAGLFALLGARTGRAFALDVEQKLLATGLADGEVERLLLCAEQLDVRVREELAKSLTQRARRP
jgi:PAS domain S-box-containing protein